jgi:hypothetical protein
MVLLLATGQFVVAAEHRSTPTPRLPSFGANPTSGGEWNFELVNSSGRIFIDSMVLDDEGDPHMSIRDSNGTQGELKYAHRTESGWDIEVLDTCLLAQLGNSLALDSGGNPHISYHCQTRTSEGLKYARLSQGKWSIETVETGNTNGQAPSIAVDSNGHPHITYADGLLWVVKYAKWTGAKWEIEILDKGLFHSSIAIDSNDNPRVSYCAYSKIMYAEWTGSNWSKELVDGDARSCRDMSVNLDSNDDPHIGYIHEFRHPDYWYSNFKYAKRVGDTWKIEVVDPDARLQTASSGAISLALDSRDYPHLSYSDNYVLEYTEWNGSNWETEAVDFYVSGSCMALDNYDQPHIGFIHSENPAFANRDLLYASKTVEMPSRFISLNIDPNALNLRSRGKWIIAYLTTENALAVDIDPSSLLVNDIVRPERWDIQNDTTLMVKFDRAAVLALVPVSDNVDIKVTGQWKDGESFELHDIIGVIGLGGYRVASQMFSSRETPI